MSIQMVDVGLSWLIEQGIEEFSMGGVGILSGS
jgi:hypothetical protein